MDYQSYEGFHRRLLHLESILSPSFDAPPVLEQLEKLNAVINEKTAGEIQSLFKLLNESNIWHRLPTLKSEVVGRDELDIQDYKNVVLANKDRMMNFLKEFEEVIRLAEMMDKLMKSSSQHYESLLNTAVPIDAYHQITENYSKLLVRSMLLLERNFKIMVRENEYWVELEKKLNGIDSNINSLLRKHELETRYT